MPSKEVVFIHHTQRGGRLSQHNAQKVWGYVSRRSWQKRPKQMTIKMWKPPRGQDESHPPSDQETNAIPYSNFQQAYLSKICFRHVRPPEGLAILETTIFVIREETVRSYLLEEPEPSTKEELKASYKLGYITNMVSWSIKSGANRLLTHNVSQAFASFEFASRHLKECVNEINVNFLQDISPALAYAQSRNGHDVVQQFLKQIAALAAQSLGPMHPISICARNLLVMGITPALVEKLLVAGLEAIFSTKLVSPHRVECRMFTARCEILCASYDLDVAERTYSDLIARAPKENTIGWRYQEQFLSLSMAQLCLHHHSFFKAASVISNAPADLEEYVREGWVPRIPTAAPLAMTMIVWQLYLLGQALAGQGDHESANATFKSAISAGLKYFDRDNPMNIEAQKAYSEYLSSQNLKEEADEIERIVDLGLDMYKLTILGNK